jgi:hypothetical protein
MSSTVGLEQLDHADALRVRMRQLLHDTSSTDVTFIVGPKAVRVGAHRAVVKCASEPLGAMLYSNMREGLQAEVSLPAFDPEAFREFLEYVYTGELKLNVVSAVHLHKLADMYGVAALRDACCKLLRQPGSIQVSKAYDVLSAALFCENNDVAEVCMCVIASNGNDSLNRPEFKNLSVDILERILQRDDLAVEEGEVFNAFLRWCVNTSNDGERRDADQIQRLKRSVRLPLVPIRDLLGAADDSGLFSRDELFAAAKYQMHPGKVSDNTDPQFVRRVRARHVLSRWELRGQACGLVALSDDAACLRKVGKSGWNVLAIADLPGIRTVGGQALLQCKIRIDHINADKSGLVIGAVNSYTDSYSKCVGIGASGSTKNKISSKRGQEQSLHIHDVVTVSIDVKERLVEICVSRSDLELFCVSGSYPPGWGAEVYIGAHVHYDLDTVTIVN